MANISVTSTASNISVNTTTDTVTVGSTLSNVTVGTTVTESVDERVVALGNQTGNISLDLFSGRIFTATLTGDVTALNFANVLPGRSATIIFTQDSFGGHNLNTTNPIWNTYEFVNNYKDLDTDPLAFSIVNVLYDGSKYYTSIGVEEALIFQNSQLANSNIIVNGTTINLGSSGNISNFGALTTDNLTEGVTNLYYTDARSRAAISSTGNISYNSNTGVISENLTTTDITEGNNLYYTTARSNSAISTYFGDSANFPFTFNGNIQVNGNIDYVNVEDLLVNDQSITLNYGNASARDAFIYVDRSGSLLNNAHLKWNETSDQWEIYDGTSTFKIPTSTDDLAEGSTNLYYANALVNDFVTDNNLTLNGNVTFGGSQIQYSNAQILTGLGGFKVYSQTGPGGILLRSTVANIEFNTLNNHQVTTDSDFHAPNVIVSGTVTAGLFSGDAGGLSNIPSSNSFGIVSVAGQSNVVADIDTDQITFVAGSGITLTTDAANDSITFVSTGGYGNVDVNNYINNGYPTANISRLYVGEDNLGIDSGLVNLHDFQMIKEDLYFDAKQLNRNGSAGLNLAFIKGRGTVASPAVNNVRDRLVEFDYWGYNPSGSGFQQYLNTAGMWAYHDVDPNAVANVIPIAHEFWVREDGDYYGKSEQSVMALRSDRTITFNDTSTRGTATNGIGGNANITADGTINTVSSINATGNIVSSANINAAGGTLTGILSSNSDIITTANITGGYISAGNDAGGNGYFLGDINGAIQQEVRNETGLTLTKGQTVYLTGVATGDTPHVALANAENAAQMPAIGIVKNNIANASVGEIVTNGQMNFTGHGFTVGAQLFINGAGLLTETMPTGEGNLVQKIGKVVTSNQIIVQGAGRTNATPNLNDGNFFLGNATNQAVTADFTDEANAAILNYTGSITQLNEANISRLSTGRDNIGLDNGFSNFPDLQCIGEGTGSQDRYLQSWQYNRNGSFGGTLMFVKGRGTVASPANANIRDRIVEFDYYGHNPNGTGFQTYINNAGYHVYHDSAPQPNDVPLAHEFWVNPPGGASSSQERSVLRLRSDRTIEFNDVSLRGDDAGTGSGGNANITQDGTINTVSNINATGTITAGSMTPDELTLKSFQETVVNLGNITGDISSSINANSGSIFTGTATGNITFSSIANVSVGSSFTVKITQDGTGSRLLTSTMKFVGGDKTLSTGAGNVDVISVVYDGTDYLASLTKDYK